MILTFLESGFSLPVTSASNTPQTDGYICNYNELPYCVHPSESTFWELLQAAITDGSVVPVAYTAPIITSEQAHVILIDKAKGVLSRTDIIVTRICEGVALGTCEWDNADVIEYMDYRKSLRNIVNGTDTTSISLPVPPALPVGS